jgi:Zn-dependent alcohol dehydrogenase
MKTRAAVAWKAGEPLTVETIDIEGPKAGEVLIEIKATGICTQMLTRYQVRTRKVCFPQSWAMKAQGWYARLARA